MNWGDVPAWIGIIAALATGVYAAIVARGAKKATEDQANEMRRSNTIAEEALRISKADHRPTVVWKVEHDSGDTYKVTNIGTADAWDVEIQHEGLVHTYSDGEEGRRVRPREAVVFIALVNLQTRDNNVYVQWVDEDGLLDQWRHPLPGKR